MKKPILILACCILAGTCFAQRQSGAVYAGSHFGGSIEKAPESKAYTLSVTPAVGFFVSGSLMMGMHGAYTSSRLNQAVQLPVSSGTGYTAYSTNATVKARSWGIGPFIRYYKPASPTFAFFIEAGAGFASSKHKVDIERNTQFSPAITTSTTGVSYGKPVGGALVPVAAIDKSWQKNQLKQNSLYGNIAPGIVFFPTARVGVELKSNVLNYTRYAGARSEFNADFNLSHTSIGAGLYF